MCLNAIFSRTFLVYKAYNRSFSLKHCEVTFGKLSYWAFCCDEAHWRGCWKLLFYAMHHCNHTVIQMEWEICLPKSKLCRWEEEMTKDLFPMGHAGVALDRMENNMRELREEVCRSLKSGCHDWGCDYCFLLWKDREMRHSCSPPQRISAFCRRSCVYPILPLDPHINLLWHDAGRALCCSVNIWFVV